MTMSDGLPCERCGTNEWYKCRSCKHCKKKKYEKNKDKRLEYRERNKDYLLKQKKDYYKRTREKRLRYQRSYIKTKTGKQNRRATENRRRTRKTGAGGSYSKSEFLELCRHYNCHCLRCGKQFPIENLTADHVVAVSNEGSSNIDNIQPLCQPCNSSKGAKNTDYRNKVEWDKYGKPVFWWQAGLQI